MNTTGSADPQQLLALLKASSASSLFDPEFFSKDRYKKYLAEKANYYNTQVHGELKYYDCEKCLNKGYLMEITEQLDEKSVACDCLKIRECYKAIEESGIKPEELERMTFDNFTHREEWQTKLKYTAKRYIDQLNDGNKLENWLYLSGQSGCGKTHLCTACCQILLHRGFKVKYVTWRKLVRDLQQNRFKDNITEKIMREISECDVLYIDDFLKSEKPEKDLAIEIINMRYASKKPTIISSEHLMDSLIALDQAVAGRIKEMCGKNIAQVSHKEGRNYRLNNN